jgi:hypothetical protein
VVSPGLRVAPAGIIFPTDTVGVQPATGRRSGGASSSFIRANVRFVAHLDWGDEAVAAPGDVYDEPIAIAPIAQCATQCGNMDRQVGRLDEYVGPNPTHQFFFANQLTWSVEQHDEDFQSAAPEAHWLVAFEQKKLCRVQAERPERDFGRWRDGAIAHFPE